jgi:hypothetical protein
MTLLAEKIQEITNIENGPITKALFNRSENGINNITFPRCYIIPNYIL